MQLKEVSWHISHIGITYNMYRIKFFSKSMEGVVVNIKPLNVPFH